MTEVQLIEKSLIQTNRFTNEEAADLSEQITGQIKDSGYTITKNEPEKSKFKTQFQFLFDKDDNFLYGNKGETWTEKLLDCLEEDKKRLKLIRPVISEFLESEFQEAKIRDKGTHYILEKNYERDFKACCIESIVDIPQGNISLDYNFVKNLNLYDVLRSDCFDANNEIGREFLCLFGGHDFWAVVAKKMHVGKYLIKIELAIFHIDKMDECIKKLKNN